MSDPSIPTSADDPNDPSIQAAPPLEVGVPPAIPTDAPAVGGRSSRSALFIVFLVVVIDLLGFGIVLPLLPRYGELYVGQLARHPAAAEAANQHDWRIGAIVGALLAIFSLMQFIFMPIWGRVSDRVGRRPILLLGLAGSVVFYTLFGYASDLPAAPMGGAGAAAAVPFAPRGRRRRGDRRHRPGRDRRLHAAGTPQARHGPDRHGLRHRLHHRAAGRHRLAVLGAARLPGRGRLLRRRTVPDRPGPRR